MHGVLAEITSAQVAVQTLGVFESALYSDRCRIRRCAHEWEIDPPQPLHLVVQRTVDTVIRMARVTSHVRRYPVVLEVLRWNVTGVIDVEALPIRNHDVAGNAELRLFRALNVCVHPSHDA